jgi:OmpA-OmpF porin, OOP family
MKQILCFLLLICSFNLFGQVTENPSIKRKSTADVFISKIEIFEDKTLVHMYFQAKTPKEALNDYLRQNPREADQLRRMDPFTRQMILQQLQQQMGGSTISFQPSSYLRTSDGKKYKFLGLSNIPKAPERRNVEPGKRYNFKVTFEKIPKGFELIDLIENKSDKTNDFTFWNFNGIRINNPAEDGIKKEEKSIDDEDNITETEVVVIPTEFRIFGKIKDAETEIPISAKISCEESKNSIDSLQTSKSGSYEFIIKPDSTVVLIVSAPGYKTVEENMNLKLFKNKEFFQKDIFLEKAIEIKPLIVKTEEPIKPKEEIPIIKEEKKPEIIGLPSENKAVKDAFQLDKVYFKLGEAIILPESYLQLDKLANYLKENMTLKIQIEGHSDNQGDAKLNKKLSLERAFTVREYLVAKGVNNKRIKFVGLGDSQPISSNNKEEDRKKNRRVEYRFIE